MKLLENATEKYFVKLQINFWLTPNTQRICVNFQESVGAPTVWLQHLWLRNASKKPQMMLYYFMLELVKETIGKSKITNSELMKSFDWKESQPWWNGEVPKNSSKLTVPKKIWYQWCLKKTKSILMKCLCTIPVVSKNCFRKNIFSFNLIKIRYQSYRSNQIFIYR